MILIVGLGNPGTKYQKTRHNIGFRVIDHLKSLNLKGVTLAKPKTFMNLSGKAVKSLITKYKIPTSNLWVVHDDIDLPLGKIRISKNRGAGGHKGVESIIKELGTPKDPALKLGAGPTGQAKNFVRFRIGIQPKSGKPKNVEKFVLQKFNKDEGKIVKEVIKKTAEAVELFLKEGLEKTMNKYNK